MPEQPPAPQQADRYRLQVRRIRRTLARPLATANGRVIDIRESVLVRVQPTGAATASLAGYGEAATLPWFGTETADQAESALLSLGGDLQATELCAALQQLAAGSACARWALECALIDAGALALPLSAETTTGTTTGTTVGTTIGTTAGKTADTTAADTAQQRTLPVAALLSSADTAALERAIQAGFRTFKLKAGLRTQQEEWPGVRALLDFIATADAAESNGAPATPYRLRLDANGSLDNSSLAAWQQALEPYSRFIDFIEQPLPAGQEIATAEAFAGSSIAFALDESLTTLARLKAVAAQVPQAVLVIKPSLLGDFRGFVNWRAHEANRNRHIVYSTALETGIGLRHALRLAALDPCPPEAAGFGTGSLFADDGLGSPAATPYICVNTQPATTEAGRQELQEMETIWKRS